MAKEKMIRPQLLGVEMDGKFKMYFGKDGDFDIEFFPHEYPAEFFRIVKKKNYQIKGELRITAKGADIRNVIFEGEMKKIKNSKNGR